MFSGLVDVITVQNFRTIGQGVFVGWVPENGMFPQESEVVLNTVLSANALHVIMHHWSTSDLITMMSLKVKRLTNGRRLAMGI
jgi:hypothetical protein